MCGESSRALAFNPIVKDSNVYIICNAIVSMDNGVRDNFVKRLFRILYLFQPRGPYEGCFLLFQLSWQQQNVFVHIDIPR
jgi:hypothetical protein